MKQHAPNQSKTIAFCGVMTALGVLLLMLGGIVPFGTFACPLLAMTVLVPVEEESGPRAAAVSCAAMAVLGLLLCPDREAALFFVFLGYYPLLCRRVEKRRPWCRVLIRLAVVNAGLVLMYAAAVYLFRLEEVRAELPSASLWLTAAFLLLANAAFLLYDAVLRRVTVLYRTKWRKFLFR